MTRYDLGVWFVSGAWLRLWLSDDGQIVDDCERPVSAPCAREAVRQAVKALDPRRDDGGLVMAAYRYAAGGPGSARLERVRRTG